MVDATEGDEPPSGGNPAPNQSSNWCKCGRRRDMPTEVENKCCRFGNLKCLTQTDAFVDLCLNANILGVNMRIREDELAEEDRTNANYRHYAYRNYVYWRFGRLDKGQRMVIIPSCVLSVRGRFPAADSIYTGFIPGENLPA
ncbi:P2X purinoceptor 7 [Holothuria leucospilota]|uniref:P2X purinoceptor 7 n=1 Tax=Holothuria leucospilota TaxID=206669 RepID=A0A9Q1HK81_HOLLE|nr:P2X purinoceptor 7 [Holothuria leucospilota]